MSDTIIGLDIGTWSVKVVEIDPRDGTVAGFQEVRLPIVSAEQAESSGASTAEGADTAQGGPPGLPGDETPFDDQPTQVREAPTPPAGEAATKPVPGDADDTTEGQPVAADGSTELDIEPWRAAVSALPNIDTVITAERLVATMPEDKTTTVRVPVPFEEPNKVKNILPHLLDDRLPMPLSSVIYGFRVAPAALPPEGDDESPFESLVTVASKEDIGAHLAGLAEAGVDPSHLLAPELALTALIDEIWREDDAAAAILDLGHETTNLLVVKGQSVIVARSTKTAGRKLTDRIAQSFGVDFEEAERLKHEYGSIVAGQAPNQQMAQLSEAITEGLRPVVRDVRRTLQSAYARDRVEVETVYLTGGTSTINGLEKHLSAQLGVSVERLNPAGIATAGEAIPRASMPWALARIGADDTLRGRAINLRRDEFIYRGRSSYLRSQLIKFGAVAAAMLVLVFVFLFANKASHEAQRDAMQAALQEETRQLFGESVTTEKEIKLRLEGEGAGARTLIPARSAYELTFEVVNRISGDLDLELTRLEVDVDRSLIQIRGDTTDAQAVDRLVTDLEKLECLKEIKKDKLTVKGDRADFELQINSGCS